jgi:hypothetical protein
VNADRIDARLFVFDFASEVLPNLPKKKPANLNMARDEDEIGFAAIDGPYRCLRCVTLPS